ncbi:MAG: hypothetical protein ACREWE_07330 [Gammaproteobacteria bacterium]
MNVDTALGILRALAVGTNPRTGEIFPPDSPYQHPDTVRALWFILSMLEYSPDILPARAGKPWSRMENVTLRHSFQRGASIGELAKRHLRTEGGIRSRLKKLGLIEVELSVSKPHPSQEAAFLRAEKSYLDQGDYLDQEQLSAYEAIDQELKDFDLHVLAAWAGLKRLDIEEPAKSDPMDPEHYAYQDFYDPDHDDQEMQQNRFTAYYPPDPDGDLD